MPGTLDSKFGLSTGMSRPRRSVPNTSVIASNGQTVLAGAVSDALGRAHQHRLAVDQAEHLVVRGLRAGLDAGAAAQAFALIDERMQRGGLGHAGGDGLLLRTAVTRLDALLPLDINRHGDRQREPVERKR